MIPKKIVYLFGAGATHAEIERIEVDADSFSYGLQIRHVTKRVLLKAQEEKGFKEVEMFFKTKDNTNIELLISLLENNDYDDENSIGKIVNRVKDLMEKDIQGKLTKRKINKFALYKGLLEFQNLILDKEILLGLITLNYDSVLDKAYEYRYGYLPDYSYSSKREFVPGVRQEKIPLLKLHGSFDWDNILVVGKHRKIPIVPLGASKNFLRLPYNFIWGRSLEILVGCDILRVVGCSLSPNDIHLIDLLFKAHRLKGKPIEIQIISSAQGGMEIKNRYSFFPKIVTLDKLTTPRIPNPDKEGNIFEGWLRELANMMLTKEQIRGAKYLSKIAS